MYSIFFAWEKAKQKGMWHQKLSRILRTGRKGYTSLIIGPLHSLAEEQRVQIFLLMSETKQLYQKTALRAVRSSLTHILRREGKVLHVLAFMVFGGGHWSSANQLQPFFISPREKATLNVSHLGEKGEQRPRTNASRFKQQGVIHRKSK